MDLPNRSDPSQLDAGNCNPSVVKCEKYRQGFQADSTLQLQFDPSSMPYLHQIGGITIAGSHQGLQTDYPASRSTQAKFRRIAHATVSQSEGFSRGNMADMTGNGSGFSSFQPNAQMLPPATLRRIPPSLNDKSLPNVLQPSVKSVVLTVPTELLVAKFQEQRVIGKLNCTNSAQPISYTHKIYYHRNIIAISSSGLQESPMNPVPIITPISTKPFTLILDVHVPKEGFRHHILTIKHLCDQEHQKIREHILSHCRMNGLNPVQYQTYRKSFFKTKLQFLHTFLNEKVGQFGPPNELIGNFGDAVTEASSILFMALRTAYLPADGKTQDGRFLGHDEMQRRYHCCELEAVKLCLYMFRRWIKYWGSLSGTAGR